MKGKEKLIQKFFTKKSRITIADCDRLLTAYGYELRKGGGSHRTYHKKDARPITVVAPKGTKYVKSVYINLIIKYLKLEG
ncbi:MAG: type II toxin-antitoxin system HicA family toxin [Dehalococcoidales bacterium]|nr:type II toxin-antitoxin system HicA family toxin [Dehalococcoidales bacterium]